MFDTRKVRVLMVRPELISQVLRDGHVCEAGKVLLPLGTVPPDLTVICAHFDHRSRMIALGVYSETFAPVPAGIDPPLWELAFTRDPKVRSATMAASEDHQPGD